MIPKFTFKYENHVHQFTFKDEGNIPWFEIACSKYIEIIKEKFKNNTLVTVNKGIFFSRNVIERLINIFTEKQGFFNYKICKDENEAIIEKINGLVKTIVSSYALNIIEVIKRTLVHLSEIEKQFPNIDKKETDKISISGIEVQNSDPHKGGKRVVFVDLKIAKSNAKSSVISFDSLFSHKQAKNKRVVYKPANLNIDKLLVDPKESIFKLLNAENLCYKILPCEQQYGFMQYLAHKSSDYCNPNREKIEKFSYNFGVLAAVATMLGIDDRHAENVLVSKFLPFPIDLETSCELDTCGNIISTEIIDTTTGALFPISLIVAPQLGILIDKKINSVLYNSQNNKWICPNKDKIKCGFKNGLESIAINSKNIREFITNFQNELEIRFCPFQTSDFNFLRRKIFEPETLAEKCKNRFPIKSRIEELRKMIEKLSKIQCPNKKAELTEKIIIYSTILKYFSLCYLHIESIYKDLERWDIPYFSVNVKTGQLYDSNHEELKWDKNKLDQLNNDDLKYYLENLKDYCETPIEIILRGIDNLQNEYNQNGKDITKCSLYIQSMKEIKREFNLIKNNILSSNTVDMSYIDNLKEITSTKGKNLSLTEEIIIFILILLDFIILL